MSDKRKLDGKARQIKWIPCKNLKVVWPGAQREFKPGYARQIANEFDPDKFDPPKVTLPEENGIHHIIEGQHRIAAVELLWGPEEKVPCEVMAHHDEVQAASLFVGIDTSKKRLQPLDIFKVKITAKDEAAVVISKIVTELGYNIGSKNQGKNIAAVSALTAVYRKHGADVLRDALKLIQATWGKDPNAVVAPIIRGYGAFIAEYGNKTNWQHLKEAIATKYTPGRLLGAAKTAREMMGGSTPDAIKGVLVSNYNRKLGGKKAIQSESA